jgi:hypothetical protein
MSDTEDACIELARQLRETEAERDTARVTVRNIEALVSDLDPPDILSHWLADRAALTALQAKVARAVTLVDKWSTWLPAWAKDSLLEALR